MTVMLNCLLLSVSGLLGGFIGGFAGSTFVAVRDLHARTDDDQSDESRLDGETEVAIDYAAAAWASEHHFPEAEGLVADKLRLVARLRGHRRRR